jgi:hypothetical protein
MLEITVLKVGKVVSLPHKQKTRLLRVGIDFLIQFLFAPSCAPLIPLSFPRDFSPFGAVSRIKPKLE